MNNMDKWTKFGENVDKSETLGIFNVDVNDEYNDISLIKIYGNIHNMDYFLSDWMAFDRWCNGGIVSTLH